MNLQARWNNQRAMTREANSFLIVVALMITPSSAGLGSLAR